MRALQQMSLNGPQDLRLISDAPVPSPGPGEVLIRVTAAGVTSLTFHRPAAYSRAARGRRTWPVSRAPAKSSPWARG
jgi:hypothetical protein